MSDVTADLGLPSTLLPDASARGYEQLASQLQMRHSRASQFRDALRPQDLAGRRVGRWFDDSPDPNDPRALARRAEVLRAAWRPTVVNRIEFLQRRCRDRRVLDIGCVAHDTERMASPQWLHAHLAAVATTCLGVDVLEEGVGQMIERGYDAVAHDLTTGPGPVADRGPFDVIVAGELMEHVESLDMLFRTASAVLSADGEMIITTPNPYAPHRVRAARLGIVWENTDHIVYAFPSGVAELCERHGLVLNEAMTIDDRKSRDLVEQLKTVRRRVLGRQWATVGYSTFGERRVRRVGFGLLGRVARGMSVPGHRFTGETFVYVVART